MTPPPAFGQQIALDHRGVMRRVHPEVSAATLRVKGRHPYGAEFSLGTARV